MDWRTRLIIWGAVMVGLGGLALYIYYITYFVLWMLGRVACQVIQ